MIDIKLEEWEVGQTLDEISAYDKEVEVLAEVDGITYSAVGQVSCGELIEVDMGTLEIVKCH